MYGEDEINVLKHTKKSENLVDIRPGFYSLEGNDDEIRMCLSCGSVLNIKPELLIETAYERNNDKLPEFALAIRRLEIYTETDGTRISLDDIGTDIL